MIELFGYDISPILAEAGNNPFSVFWYILQHGGFIALYPVLVYMLYQYWMYYIWTTYLSKIDYVLLAIDIPKENEQSLKAVEQIFASLSGPHQVFSFLETYWDGELQPKYSLEIASLGGYIQYFIYCETRFRDVVEAAIYAQYPDAEITEVEDYTKDLPTRYPNDEYILWGVEMVKTNDDVYPIRTYKMFEHSHEQAFADPLAATLELMATLKPGENLFFQYVITPVDHHWPKLAEKVVAKIIGAKIKAKRTIADVVSDTPLKALEFTHDLIFGPEGSVPQSKDDDGQPNLMLYLTPGEQAVLTAIQEKITKVAYHTKFRFMYVAKKEVSRRKTIVGGTFGAIKQFNTLDMNGFKPGKHTVTRAEYLFSKQRKEWRKRKLMRNYRARDNDAGEAGMILNIEELASLWHFPTIGVSTSAVAAVETKKATAPMSLPLEVKREEVEEVVLAPQEPVKQAPAPPRLPKIESPITVSPETEEATSGQPPANLPIAR